MNRTIKILQWLLFAAAILAGFLHALGLSLRMALDMRTLEEILLYARQFGVKINSGSFRERLILFAIHYAMLAGFISMGFALLGQLCMEWKDYFYYKKYMPKNADTQVTLTTEVVEPGVKYLLDRVLAFILLGAGLFYLLGMNGGLSLFRLNMPDITRRIVFMPAAILSLFGWMLVCVVSFIISLAFNRYFKGQSKYLFEKNKAEQEEAERKKAELANAVGAV